MSGILWVVLGVAIGLLTPLLILRRRRDGDGSASPLPAAGGRPQSRTAVPSRPPAPSAGGLKRKLVLRFHGVSLKPGLEACPAVQALAGQRFLPAEAPTVPLPGCDQKKCQCAYSHHSDRRERGDRRSGWGSFGGFTPTASKAEQRGKNPDRRSRSDSPG